MIKILKRKGQRNGLLARTALVVREIMFARTIAFMVRGTHAHQNHSPHGVARSWEEIQVPLMLELRLLDSESKVLTI